MKKKLPAPTLPERHYDKDLRFGIEAVEATYSKRFLNSLDRDLEMALAEARRKQAKQE